ncbi:hypothetical protein IW262DRAFT_263426 [Armillaria fumosa]|nr:hypothetical protein IW262DRAFT_263426 [Armillaria fumosa]
MCMLYLLVLYAQCHSILKRHREIISTTIMLSSVEYIRAIFHRFLVALQNPLIDGIDMFGRRTFKLKRSQCFVNSTRRKERTVKGGHIPEERSPSSHAGTPRLWLSGQGAAITHVTEMHVSDWKGIRLHFCTGAANDDPSIFFRSHQIGCNGTECFLHVSLGRQKISWVVPVCSE